MKHKQWAIRIWILVQISCIHHKLFPRPGNQRKRNIPSKLLHYLLMSHLNLPQFIIFLSKFQPISSSTKIYPSLAISPMIPKMKSIQITFLTPQNRKWKISLRAGPKDRWMFLNTSSSEMSEVSSLHSLHFKILKDMILVFSGKWAHIYPRK